MTDDAFDPTKTDAKTDAETHDVETHDDAGDDEAVDDGSLLGAANNDIDGENASDDAHGIIGEEA